MEFTKCCEAATCTRILHKNLANLLVFFFINLAASRVRRTSSIAFIVIINTGRASHSLLPCPALARSLRPSPVFFSFIFRVGMVYQSCDKSHLKSS